MAEQADEQAVTQADEQETEQTTEQAVGRANVASNATAKKDVEKYSKKLIEGMRKALGGDVLNTENIVKITASVYYIVSGAKKLTVETRHQMIVDALVVVIEEQNISDTEKDILKTMLPSVVVLVLDLLNCLKEKTIQLEKSLVKYLCSCSSCGK